MERLFRSLKTEWVPATGYMSFQDAKRDISYYLMDYYNWRRPHQHNGGIPPAEAENRSNRVSGFCWPLHPTRNWDIAKQKVEEIKQKKLQRSSTRLLQLDGEFITAVDPELQRTGLTHHPLIGRILGLTHHAQWHPTRPL